jgi:hypothetical protein
MNRLAWPSTATLDERSRSRSRPRSHQPQGRWVGSKVSSEEVREDAPPRSRFKTQRSEYGSRDPRRSRATRSTSRAVAGSSNGFLAIMAEGPHLIPSRTRSLSLPAPMVLQGELCGRVGRCQIYAPAPRQTRCRRFFFGRVPAAAARHGRVWRYSHFLRWRALPLLVLLVGSWAPGS